MTSTDVSASWMRGASSSTQKKHVQTMIEEHLCAHLSALYIFNLRTVELGEPIFLFFRRCLYIPKHATTPNSCTGIHSDEKSSHTHINLVHVLSATRCMKTCAVADVADSTDTLPSTNLPARSTAQPAVHRTSA